MPNIINSCSNNSEVMYFRPAIPLVLSLTTGIAFGSWFPGHTVLASVLISLCIVWVVCLIYRRRAAIISPIVLCVALGYVSIQSWTAPDFPSHHLIYHADRQPWKIAGIVDTPPEEYLKRQRFILRADTLSRNDRPFPVTGKLRVTVSGKTIKLSKGDRIVFSSRIRSIRNFNNPGGFDYVRHMAFKKVWGTAYVSEKNVDVIDTNSDHRLSRMVQYSRRKISDLIEKTTPGKHQGVLKALIIGDKYAVSKDSREAFNRAGIGHLLAISGLHIGIVATAAFLFFQWMLSHIDLFLWNAWTKKGAVVLSMVPVSVYGLLSGMSPSTQRAVIMVSVFLTAFLFEREQDLINTLSLAALLILVVHPPSLFSISFQLSFIAVLAILYGLSRIRSPWSHGFKETKEPIRLQILSKLFYFFLASLFAVLGTLPLVMFYFNQVSLVGLLTNLLFVPLVGFVVVPIGLLAVFLYPVTQFGASACLDAGAAVLSRTLSLVDYISRLPFAASKTVTPSPVEICCYYLLLWALLNLFSPSQTSSGRKRAPSDDGVDRNLSRKPAQGKVIHGKKAAAAVAVTVILVLIADAVYWTHQRFQHKDLRVTVIDVGQGSSALLEFPEGRCLLIDGGGFYDNSVFDVGERIIAPLLWRKKIKTVDTLILSHPNSDHLNGLIYIAKHFNVKQIWTNNQAANTLNYKAFTKTTEHLNIRMPRFDNAPRRTSINGVALDILYPPSDFLDKRKKEGWRTINNNSLVLKATFGTQSFLFPGDLKRRAEEELVSTAKNDLESTVLISPHHGSRTSSSLPFIEAVNPDLVIISCGWENRFGFPHPQILKRYRSRGYGIFRTDTQGAVVLSTDGVSLTVRPTITGKPALPADRV